MITLQCSIEVCVNILIAQTATKHFENCTSATPIWGHEEQQRYMKDIEDMEMMEAMVDMEDIEDLKDMKILGGYFENGR